MSSSIYLLPRRFRSEGVASYLIKYKTRNRHIIWDDFVCKAKCNVTVLKMPITYRMHKMERHHKLLLHFTFANLQFSVDVFPCFSNPLMDPVPTHCFSLHTLSHHLITVTLLVLVLKFSVMVACLSACAAASHTLIITKHTSWSQSYVMRIRGTHNDAYHL